jgi:hypothetical protein
MTKHVAPNLVKDVNLQPGHGKAGRHPTRDFLDTLSGNKDPGMFGRMFPKLPPLKAKDEALDALAAAMMDAEPNQTGDNPNVPAGFTYLGQFIDHDISLDLTSLSEKEKDPLGVENFRTPASTSTASMAWGRTAARSSMHAIRPRETSTVRSSSSARTSRSGTIPAASSATISRAARKGSRSSATIATTRICSLPRRTSRS